MIEKEKNETTVERKKESAKENPGKNIPTRTNAQDAASFTKVVFQLKEKFIKSGPEKEQEQKNLIKELKLDLKKMQNANHALLHRLRAYKQGDEKRISNSVANFKKEISKSNEEISKKFKAACIEIKRLREVNKKYEEEKRALESNLSTLDKEYERLKVESDITSSLKGSLVKIDIEKDKLTKELEELKNINTEVKKKFLTLKTQFDENNKKLNSITTEKQSIENKIEIQKKELDEQQVFFSKLKNQNAKLLKEREESQKLLSELKDKNIVLTKQSYEDAEKYRALSAQHQNEFKSLHESINNLNNEKNKLLKEIGDSEERFYQVKTENKELLNTLENRLSEKKRLSQKYQEEIDDLKTQLKLNENDYSTLIEKTSKLEAENVNYKKEHIELVEKVKKNREDKKKLIRYAKDLRDKSKDSVSVLENEISKYKSEIEKITNNFNGLRHTNETLIVKLDEQKELLHNSKIEHDGIKIDLQKQIDELKELNSKTEEKFSFYKNEAQKNKKVSDSALHQMRVQRNELEKTVQTLKKDKEEIEEKNAQIMKRNEELSAELNLKEDDIKDLEAEVESLNQRINAAEVEYQNLSAASSESKSALKNQVFDLNKELERLKEKLEFSRKDSEKTSAAHKEKVESLEASLKIKTQSLSDSKNEIDSKDSEIEELRGKIVLFEKSMSEKDEKISFLESSIETKSKELKVSEASLAEARNNIKDLVSAKEQMHEKVDEFKSKKDNLIVQKDLEIELVKGELSEKIGIIEDLGQEIQAKSEKIRELGLEIEYLNKNHNNYKDSMELEVQNLKLEIEKVQGEMRDLFELRDKVTVMDQDLIEKEKELNKMQEALNNKESKVQYYQKWLEEQKGSFRRRVVEFAHEVRISHNLSPINDYALILDTEIAKTKKAMEYVGLGKKYSIFEKQLQQLQRQKSNIVEILAKSKSEYNEKSKQIAAILNEAELMPTPPLPPNENS
jgi:chromosome segregation ATPase